MRLFACAAALLLAIGGVVFASMHNTIQSQSPMGEDGADVADKPVEGEESDTDTTIRPSPFDRMLGRWDFVTTMGSGADAQTFSGKAKREATAENVLVESLTMDGPDGNPLSMVSHYFYNKTTGAISFTTTCAICDVQVYGTTAWAGSDNPELKLKDGVDRWEFGMFGSPMCDSVMMALGTSVTVAEDGTETETPYELYTMFKSKVTDDGEIESVAVATMRLTPTVIPMYPDGVKRAAHGAIGKAHEYLHKMVGEWKVSMTFEPKGMPPMTMEGFSTITSVMDGRYVREEMTYSMGENYKQTLEFTYGYNNSSKLYEMSMLFSDATQIGTMAGTLDQKTGVMTMEGLAWETTIGDHIGWRAVTGPEVDGKVSTKLYGNYGTEWTYIGVVNYTRMVPKK